MDYRKEQPGISLNGEWLFAFSDTEPDAPIRDEKSLRASGLTLYPATVPGNFELDLLANGLIEDPFFGMNAAGLRNWENKYLWYSRRFSRPLVRDGYEAGLLFEGLDCRTEIWLNGQYLGRTDNMLIEHGFPLREEQLQDENEILVHIRPAVESARYRDYPPSLFAAPNRYESLYVRKAPHMYGWDIMPRIVSAGIWRPVRLLVLPKERFTTVFLETLSIASDHSRARLALHFGIRSERDLRPDAEIEVEGSIGGAVAFHQRQRLLFNSGRIDFTVENPRLWWPRGRGEAALYDVRVRLLRGDTVIDTLTFTHGIRTVELERTNVTDEAGKGEFVFRVNNEKVFIHGSNWVPADAFHSRDAERIPAMLELAQDVGCNMLRCWGGNVYENDLFYDLCDRAGILVWQDFAMACAVYPQDAGFQEQIRREARAVVRRMRQHPCIALWAGDNECDQAYGWGGRNRDPNTNVLTRVVLPEVLRDEDPTRPYLPSSPYIDAEAFAAGQKYLTENHLWGPRSYYKSDYYTQSLCHFASEIGYHGCPSPESLRKFLSPERVWPYQDNPEWILHSTSPIPGVNLYDYRVELMANQVRELFGDVPDNLEDFAFASQASQAEAKKFFVEMFRAAKWRRTGILWWNLIDGWPQFSDAVVDYYFEKKLAYHFLKRSQMPLCLVLREPHGWIQEIVACNDTRDDVSLTYRIRDVETDTVVAEGTGRAIADRVTVLGSIPYSGSAKRFYLLEWTNRETGESGVNHYLAGNPPFSLAWYRATLDRAGLTMPGGE